jgi:nitrite reductase (NADH) large subunit
LPRQLDQDGAKILKDRIENLGIDIKVDEKTEEILGKNEVSGILLSNGEKLSGKLVLISAGIRPNTELALKAGINVNKGVVVDQHLKTNLNNVYACGNMAEFEGRVYETIPAAIEQAEIAAMNMLEKNDRAYKGTTPSHTLKVVGIDLTSIGIVNPKSSRYQEVKKTDWARSVYKKIVLKENKIVGAIMLGDVKGVTTIRKVMDQKTDITKYKEHLLDPLFDYRDL